MQTEPAPARSRCLGGFTPSQFIASLPSILTAAPRSLPTPTLFPLPPQNAPTSVRDSLPRRPATAGPSGALTHGAPLSKTFEGASTSDRYPARPRTAHHSMSSQKMDSHKWEWTKPTTRVSVELPSAKVVVVSGDDSWISSEDERHGECESAQAERAEASAATDDETELEHRGRAVDDEQAVLQESQQSSKLDKAYREADPNKEHAQKSSCTSSDQVGGREADRAHDPKGQDETIELLSQMLLDVHQSVPRGSADEDDNTRAGSVAGAPVESQPTTKPAASSFSPSMHPGTAASLDAVPGTTEPKLASASQYSRRNASQRQTSSSVSQDLGTSAVESDGTLPGQDASPVKDASSVLANDSTTPNHGPALSGRPSASPSNITRISSSKQLTVDSHPKQARDHGANATMTETDLGVPLSRAQAASSAVGPIQRPCSAAPRVQRTPSQTARAQSTTDSTTNNTNTRATVVASPGAKRRRVRPQAAVVDAPRPAAPQPRAVVRPASASVHVNRDDVRGSTLSSRPWSARTITRAASGRSSQVCSNRHSASSESKPEAETLSRDSPSALHGMPALMSTAAPDM